MRQTLWQVIRFGVVGVAATATYFCTGFGLSHFSTFSALQIHLSAFVVSVVVSYVGHAYFTFGVSGKKPMLRFAGITGILFGASSLLTVILTELFAVSRFWNVVVITITYPVCSFLLHRFWTFKKSKAVVIDV